jgi:hypothetical protein
MTDYELFLEGKMHTTGDYGFDPVWMPDMLFPFQAACVEWACRKGRAALFEDCGLGKTFQQLVWAENVARHSGGRVLILTPLAVAFQTVKEGEKIGVDVVHRRDCLHDGDGIVVTNYERLHHFVPGDFAGVVCDESSILKNYAGKTRDEITKFIRHHKYRLLCTATAAPNDYTEMGTSAEALGVMRRVEMLAMFFSHDGGETQKWGIKGHAEKPFWQWVCTWARAIRRPSDMGHSDGGFSLPSLIERDHVVCAHKPLDGYLLDLPAVGLDEQRSDLRRTINERCAMAADLINAHDRPAVAWCNLNCESDRLRSMIPDSVAISGADDDDVKERAFAGFADGSIRVIVTKPSIAGFGLNWQHCAHMTFFPSHSYEQYYQCIRRCWRFGQRKPVTVDMITTEGQAHVLRNLQRKADAADIMFSRIASMMWEQIKTKERTQATRKVEVASWL